MNAFLSHRLAMRSLLATPEEEELHDLFIEALLVADDNGHNNGDQGPRDQPDSSEGFTASLESSLSLAVHQDDSFVSLPSAVVGPCTALLAQGLERRLRTALEVASKRKRKRWERELHDLLTSSLTSNALQPQANRCSDEGLSSLIVEIDEEDFKEGMDATL
jgi:hypothetical protein